MLYKLTVKLFQTLNVPYVSKDFFKETIFFSSIRISTSSVIKRFCMHGFPIATKVGAVI